MSLHIHDTGDQQTSDSVKSHVVMLIKTKKTATYLSPHRHYVS